MSARTSSWLGRAGFCLLLVACSKGGAPAAGEAKSSVAAAPAANTPTPAKPEGDKAETLPAAAELLRLATEATGGAERVAAVDSFYSEGTIEVTGQNIKGETKAWWKGGDFYTEQTIVGIGTVRAGKQGDVMWSDDPITGLRRLEGAEAEEHAWASSLLLAADWQRYFATAETTGAREIEGKKAWDVKLTSKSGATLTLTLDAESHLPVAESFQQDTPLGKVPVSVSLQDYRDVEGLKISFQQVLDQGIAKATQTTTKLEFHVPVDTSKFAMPTGGAEVVKAGDVKPEGAVPSNAASPVGE